MLPKKRPHAGLLTSARKWQQLKFPSILQTNVLDSGSRQNKLFCWSWWTCWEIDTSGGWLKTWHTRWFQEYQWECVHQWMYCVHTFLTGLQCHTCCCLLFAESCCHRLFCPVADDIFFILFVICKIFWAFYLFTSVTIKCFLSEKNEFTFENLHV